MRKSEKGPVSQFIAEQLAELDTIHQYIQGPQNSIADAASRYPCLGPKRLVPRGMANSVSEMLQCLPDALNAAENVHVYAGIHTMDLKQMVQAWISTAKGSVQQVAPAQKEPPSLAVATLRRYCVHSTLVPAVVPIFFSPHD